MWYVWVYGCTAAHFRICTKRKVKTPIPIILSCGDANSTKSDSEIRKRPKTKEAKANALCSLLFKRAKQERVSSHLAI